MPSGTVCSVSKPSTVADLVERDLVVARILVALDVRDLAALHLALDLLDQHLLRVVLARAAGVEHLARGLLARRLEHGPHRAAGVGDVDVGPPELLAEHLEVAIGPQVARELVDGQVEAHPRRGAVDGGEAQAGGLQLGVLVAQDRLLHPDLLLGVERHGRQLALLGDRHGRVLHASVVRARRGEHELLDAGGARVGQQRARRVRRSRRSSAPGRARRRDRRRSPPGGRPPRRPPAPRRRAVVVADVGHDHVDAARRAARPRGPPARAGSRRSRARRGRRPAARRPPSSRRIRYRLLRASESQTVILTTATNGCVPPSRSGPSRRRTSGGSRSRTRASARRAPTAVAPTRSGHAGTGPRRGLPRRGRPMRG